jgi:hypothetical protein
VTQAVAESPPGLSERRFGPFAVVDGPGPVDGVVEGYDRELGRRVWIVRRDAGAPPTSSIERLSIRAGCLRWLGGQRMESDAWDAYAAVSGQSLRARLTRDADWAAVHHWIDGIVTELEARQKAGWPNQALSVDHVWITGDEDAILLPFSTSGAGANATQGSLVHQVAETILQADERVVQRQGWPLRSRAMLALMSRQPTNLGALREGLEASAHHAERLTPRKRALITVSTIAPALVFGLAIGVALVFSVIRNPELNRLVPLLDYLGSHRSEHPENRTNRELVGQYVAGHFRATITGRRRQPSSAQVMLDSADWRLADSVLAALPTVTPAQLAAADRLVDSTWQGQPPRSLRPIDLLFIVVVSTALSMPFLAGLVTSLVARRGIILRVFGLDIVTPRGLPTGRLRLVWRHVVGWVAPLALCVSLLIIVLRDVTPAALAAAIVSGIVLAVSIYTGWRTPARGLAGRLSGTIVVPE